MSIYSAILQISEEKKVEQENKTNAWRQERFQNMLEEMKQVEKDLDGRRKHNKIKEAKEGK